MSIHSGHRNRMKERFRNYGIDGLEKHEVLEMLLYYCIPRRDTNAIAHALLEEFKTLHRVLNASPEELEVIGGMGENAALFISFVRQLGRFFKDDNEDEKDILWNLDRCHRYLQECFVGKKNETAMVLCLDAKCKMLGCHVVGEGSIHSANVSVRKILETVLATNATSVVLAHNHPGGLATPSGEDIHATHMIAQALKTVDVVLIDHMIVAGDDFVSLLFSGLYRPDSDNRA